MESFLNPEQNLIDICHVLINQQHRTLTDIATSILYQLGECVLSVIMQSLYVNTLGQFIPDNVTSISSIPDDVQGYADNMRQHYKHQPIVATDWPPRIGKDFFGRLALVEKQDSSTQAKSAWHMLRGQVDKTVKLTENKEICVKDVLQPTDSSLPLRVVIDGPPGIGKTTLCRNLLNMWSNRTLGPQQYDLVLYCPLRNSKIATATTLSDLFVRQRLKIPMVAEWFEKRNGEGLLIIFDGWDELSEELRQSSFAASIICKDELDQCSVIVTSRSYASSSLLEIMSNLSRHVQVIGFSKDEISTVIIRTLQKDTKLAQEIIDQNTNSRNQYKSHFTTTQSSKDSQLAVKLINDLEVRNDVQSLCYVPLVCSMVILVYCKEEGHLPTTLTQLYENFILQTIRRHVKRHDIDPHTLGSLSSLPSQLAKPLQELCQIAYTNLANTRMTFSLDQLQSLSEAVKEDYLGLMTAFTEYDEEKHQFLHLSIQEFLAAWWIAKHEKETEEVFKDHFDDDHFRLCLRFVAGLTHLEHESYQQYFNKQQLDLQCHTEQPALLGFEIYYYSWFYHKFFGFQDHISSDDSDNVPILLLQLLYESQNTTLCNVLAQSINSQSLCLVGHKEWISLFDWLCLSYFINNSNTTWNSLDLGEVPNEKLSIFTAGLISNPKSSIQEFHCDASFELMPQIFRFPQLNTLCYVINIPEGMCAAISLHGVMLKYTLGTTEAPKCFHSSLCYEIEKSISINSTVKKLFVKTMFGGNCDSHILSSIIKGVTKNKVITLLSLKIDRYDPLCRDPLPNGVIEQLLRENNTLKALVLDLSNDFIPSSLKIAEVNTPLTALEIGEKSSKLMTLLPHIKGLHCLILHYPYPPRPLFLSHPSLHTLALPLDTAESAIKLFTILQTNTTLKVLSVEIKEEGTYASRLGTDWLTSQTRMGTSLQDMLKQNQILKYLEINNSQDRFILSSFLSFLTTGLRHNTSLQQLSVPIPLNNEVTSFLKIISQSNNLTELEMDFRLDCNSSLDSLYYACHCSEREMEQIMTPLFYEQLLPAVTNMLQLLTTIKILRIKCENINGSSQPKWEEIVQLLYRNIYIHPSLEYIEMTTGYNTFFILKDTFDDQEMILIEIHKKKQPHKLLPVVKFFIGNKIVNILIKYTLNDLTKQ